MSMTPILDRLGERDARVVSVTKTPEGRFEVREECDGYFSETLTADELAALGRELIELSETVNNVHSL